MSEGIFIILMEMLSISGRNMFEIIFSLFLAITISIVISQIYKYTHRGLSFELSFMTTLVLLSPIVSVVMLFIRGDLVLSLGLIGSLSIIRFRTPIKDTRDMVFLFWVIAVGLGCGTYNWSVVVISSIIISLVVILFHIIRYGQSYNVDYVLVVGGNSKYNTKKIYEVINTHTQEITIRSHETEGSHWEIVCEVRFTKLSESSTDSLIDSLKDLEGVNKVSLLAPQISLPV